ncbi:single-stranded DNA-binding protein [Ornithinimicrobium sufpigmenti]|uniref:single-stranded DNA-binding protein n=1 Tax=Ornithinimicrobium sufpigmenti TaxID=2508882 RepID=UPI0010358230|nr:MULTISPECIES: single-stranded DNA-binding protein [unclassified Ornithinimicrobium]
MAQTMLTISGRVAQEPKIRHGKTTGAPFCVVSVAVNNDRFDKEQERWVNLDTTFYELVCFGGLGANVAASLKVGDPVVALGRFKVSSWEGETQRSQTPTITCEHLGPDLRFGTAALVRGQAGYGQDRVDQDVDFREITAEREAAASGSSARSPAADARDLDASPGPDADEDGVVSEEDAEEFLARSA